MEDRILEITQLEQQIEKQGVKNENRLRNFSTTSTYQHLHLQGTGRRRD